MIHPEKMLKTTPVGSSQDNVLYLDPSRIIGLLSFANATSVIIDGPPEHSVFTVKESVDDIKRELLLLSEGQ